MEKNRFTTFVAVVLLLINLLLVAFIFFRDRGHRPPPHPDEIINNRLHFTKEQWQKFETLKEAHHSQVVRCRDSIRDRKRELFELLKNKSRYLNEKARAIDEISRLQKRIERITFDHFHDLRQLCDDEQKKSFDVLIEEMAMALDHPGPPGRRP